MQPNAPQLKSNESFLARMTQFLSGGKKATAAEPAVVADSEEKKQERLAAYQKFCEEQAKIEAPRVKKKMKFRAKDFNA